MPVNSVKELIEYIKAHPGKLAYGSNGVGGSYHLEMEMIKQNYGLDITHVPYKGGNAALMAAVVGVVPIGLCAHGLLIGAAARGQSEGSLSDGCAPLP